MRKSFTFALAIGLLFTAWLVEAKKQTLPQVYLVTSFDFARYPSCQSGRTSNCILAIRFYDADSDQQLAEVATKAEMSGRQRIAGKAKEGAMPQRVYAVTVYLDNDGQQKEGPPGQTSELRDASKTNPTR